MRSRSVTGVATVVAAMGALATVLDLLVLRAASDGAAHPAVLTAVGLATFAGLLPLVARGVRSVGLFTALAAALVLGHLALLAATTGRVGHGGVVGLVCCPPAPGATGPLAGLTGTAGVALLVTQLLSAAVVGVALMLSRTVAVDASAAVVPLPRVRLPRVLLALVLPALPQVAPTPADHRPVVALRSALLARATSRRGPPARLHLQPSAV